MKTNLRRNAVYALAEVITSGLVLFFLYRAIVSTLGVKALGTWSLVLATTAFGRAADIGIGAGLSRFVAMAHARGEARRASSYVETALISNLVLYVVIALAIWAPAVYALSLSMPHDSFLEARRLLPLSLVSFVLTSLANAVTGAIVGQHRSHQKSVITILGLIAQFLVAVLLVKDYGLLALAWAQIAQFALMTMMGWLLFLRNDRGTWSLGLPVHWRGDHFKILAGFGMKVQAVSLATMFYDPLVKMLMSSLGGLETLGFLEMSQRFIFQVRQILVIPMQTLVPAFSHYNESEPGRVEHLYLKAVSVAISVGLPMMIAVIAASPLLSWIWIGRIEPTFVTLTAIGSLGWYVNLLAAPAYLVGVGTGYMRGNLVGAFATTLGFCLLCAVTGRVWGGYGVAAASSVALAFGGILTMQFNCRFLEIPALPSPRQILSTLHVQSLLGLAQVSADRG